MGFYTFSLDLMEMILDCDDIIGIVAALVLREEAVDKLDFFVVY